MMWKISDIILKGRLIIIFLIIGATALMMHYAYPPKFAYQMANILPSDHPVRTDFENFIYQFDKNNGNTITIAIKDADFFDINHLKQWDQLTRNIESLKEKQFILENRDTVSGIESVVSVTNLPILKKDTIAKKFITEQWYNSIYNLEDLEVAIKEYKKQKIYTGMLCQTIDDTVSSIMLIVMNKTVIESKARDIVIKKIDSLGDLYESNMKKLNLSQDSDLKYSGLPYLRTKHSVEVKQEIKKFILLTLLITSLILFLFFRSFKSTIISIIVVVIGVIFSFGIIGILQQIHGGFEINIITALVPPLIIVIGIPNCIFLINKYHTEYKKSKNQETSLHLMISKIGNITLLTNLTTASGFAAFILTESDSLQEFGVVASLSILSIFIISLLIIPIWFSYLPEPQSRHTKHLDKKWIISVVSTLSHWVKNKRKAIFSYTIALTIIGLVGLFQVKTSGNITDDISRDGDLYKDLQFFEQNFGGVMPLEIIIDTKQKNGISDISFMRKVEELQIYLSTFDDFSKPISYIEFIKYANQAYKDDGEKYFTLTNIQKDLPRISSFLRKSDVDNLDIKLTDVKNSKARISFRIKDIPTSRMDSILKKLEPKLKKIFVDEDTIEEYIVNPARHIGRSYYNEDDRSYNVRNIIITGVSYVFLEGTKFLVGNLVFSLLLVILLISVFMAWMFRSWRMVLISLIPNLIPLLITGAIMGYFEIPIKPSTILVFSIAFGISVDDTIHFLAKYRQELLDSNWNIKKSVYRALKETGVSMIYTSVVLFFGFIIFVTSDFRGTIALGLLVSITLFVAMLANLLLLPALLLSLEKLITTKAFKEPLIDIFEENDIDLKLKDK